VSYRVLNFYCIYLIHDSADILLLLLLLLFKYKLPYTYISLLTLLRILELVDSRLLDYLHSHIDYIFLSPLSFWVSFVIMRFHFRILIVYWFCIFQFSDVS
jgi:hypothetical protein